MTQKNIRCKLDLETYFIGAHPDWWFKQTPPKGAANAYKCNTCGKVIITADMDKGTTPVFMGCKATEACDGRMTSAGYPKGGVPEVLRQNCKQFEWYRPETNALGMFHEDQIVDEYIRQGGLLLREKA